MTPLLLALPWIAVLVFVLFIAKIPSELPARERSEVSPPRISVIVPARNETLNIETCLASLTASTYPTFEVIVVDDRSDDDTAELARAIAAGNAERLVVVDGAELPDGWLGKPWACHQGARVARGEMLLFTDADTRHAPELMARALAGQREESADLLTVVGRQLMESFWERLVQPQIFLVMLFRFPDFERTVKSGRWRDAIANGQFILFPRDSYEAIGGHEAVRDEVVEDLALAQLVKRAGRRLRIRSAKTDLETRMYRSLPQLIEGWSKNIVMGGLQSVPALLRSVVSPMALVTGVSLWLAPPAALIAALVGFGGGGLLVWSATVCSVSVTIWSVFTWQMGGPPAYGALYPLGAAVGTHIFLRSWIRGTHVEWKGRHYTVKSASERR